MSDKHLTADELDFYIEKELDDRARAGIERHLSDCAPCRGRLARDQRMNRALQTLPRQDPPRDLAARIGSAVEGARGRAAEGVCRDRARPGARR